MFHKGGSSEDAGDNRSAASAESLPVNSAVSHSSAKSEAYHPCVTTNMVTVGSNKTTSSKSTIPPASSRQASSGSVRRTGAPTTSSSVSLSVGTGGTSIPRAKPVPNLSQANAFPPSSHYPVSPGRAGLYDSRPASTSDSSASVSPGNISDCTPICYAPSRSSTRFRSCRFQRSSGSKSESSGLVAIEGRPTCIR